MYLQPRFALFLSKLKLATWSPFFAACFKHAHLVPIPIRRHKPRDHHIVFAISSTNHENARLPSQGYQCRKKHDAHNVLELYFNNWKQNGSPAAFNPIAQTGKQNWFIHLTKIETTKILNASQSHWCETMAMPHRLGLVPRILTIVVERRLQLPGRGLQRIQFNLSWLSGLICKFNTKLLDHSSFQIQHHWLAKTTWTTTNQSTVSKRVFSCGFNGSMLRPSDQNCIAGMQPYSMAKCEILHRLGLQNIRLVRSPKRHECTLLHTWASGPIGCV